MDSLLEFIKREARFRRPRRWSHRSHSRKLTHSPVNSLQPLEANFFRYPGWHSAFHPTEPTQALAENFTSEAEANDRHLRCVKIADGEKNFFLPQKNLAYIWQ
ncbi:hypothetical protein THTE_1021 [Thermogutta terrifontis]|uniref:Uncharacterized protein n=1 Tax=Thermogutta terrifontis TaxID=1331910 RepID=A0A286RCE0_9BACT|nr:hypothetical protein THTE_1021 [Thermogutta terrifontis]